MRKHTATFVIGVLLLASGFAAAAIASNSGLAGALQTTVTSATTTTSTTVATTTAQEKKVTICHHTRGKKGTKHVTIRISRSALKAHQKHGDTLGACSTPLNQRIHSSKAHAKKFHKKAKATSGKKGKGKGRGR